MPLGKASKAQLLTCHPDLIRLVVDVVAQIDAGALAYAGIRDVSVLCGHRTEAEQNACFNAKPPTSKLPWPKSKHNSLPSRAVDMVPYPVDWKDGNHEHVLRGFVLARAWALGIKIRVISWDLPHYELV